LSANTESALRKDTEPILGEAEVERRVLLLARLQAALAERGVQAVAGRHQRLALGVATGNGSGPTDPRLYIYAPDGVTVRASTDGIVYRLDGGEQYPVTDRALAAAAICGHHAPVTA
jgi:hypothetical protein